MLGSLAATSAYLVANKKVTAVCSISPTCKNCGKFELCDLPQAEETKNGKEK